MAYSITNAKSDLSGILKGQSTSKITGLTELFNRAARQVLLDLDPQETKVSSQIVLYDKVYDYDPPADLKGNKIIDIRPQVNRTVRDNVSQTYSESFDLGKGYDGFKVQVAFRSGTKVLRIDKPSLPSGIVVDTITGISDNGTWAVGGDATSLTEDNIYYKSNKSSLRFNLDGSGTSGYLENSTMTAVDLSEHEDQSAIFFWVYLPNASSVTSIDGRWGSSSSAYWDRTVTAPVFGSFVNGWNIIKLDWNGATETGGPDSSAIDYFRVTINYDGTADTDFRFDGVRSVLPELNEIIYYSKYLFSDSTTGAFKESTDSGDDTVNLDTETYNIFLWKCAELACQQVPDYGDVGYFKNEYMTSLRRYKSLYKSEVEKPQQSYYRMPRQGTRGRGGKQVLTP